MKRQANTLIALSLCLALLAVTITQGAAQERQLELEKILNPMPNYDPFEKAGTTPQFFPDDTDKRARELLIDALTNRKESLAGHLEALQAEDDRLQKQHGTATGLSEYAQDLVNNTIQDREGY